MAGKSVVVRKANRLLREAGSKERITLTTLDAVFRAVYELVREGQRVSIQHFGTFLRVQRAPRRGWNAHAGVPAPIPARVKLMFKTKIHFPHGDSEQ